jgi:predicted house-cleaning noncanonical NTP pyrophosphatase (MazG superfamily)
MPSYNKLVRDNILKLITESGKTYQARALDQAEMLSEIKKKIVEEALEVAATTNDKDLLEELADVLELMYATLENIDVSWAELEQVREHKKAKNGGFEKGYYLIDVTDELD